MPALTNTGYANLAFYKTWNSAHVRDVFWPGVRERASRHEINLELRVDFYTDDLILVLTDTDPERKALFLSRKEMNEGAFESEEASARLDRLIAELTFPVPLSMADALDAHRAMMRKAVSTQSARFAAMAFTKFGS